MPLHELARVQVAAERAGRHDRLRARARRADAHRAHERRQRDQDVLAEGRDVAAAEVEDAQVRLGELVGQQAEAGEDRRPAPAARVQVEDLDREGVAHLGALDVHRPGQRVDAVPVQARDHARVRAGPDLVVAHVAGLEDHGVAVGDGQQGFVARVPREVHAVGRAVVRARHEPAIYCLYPVSKPFQDSWTAGHCGQASPPRTMPSMREPLITATLFSIFVGTTGTAKAIGAIQRLYVLDLARPDPLCGRAPRPRSASARRAWRGCARRGRSRSSPPCRATGRSHDWCAHPRAEPAPDARAA